MSKTIAQKLYYKKYQQNNKTKFRKYALNYYNRNKEKCREKNKAYYYKNKEAFLKRSREYRKEIKKKMDLDPRYAKEVRGRLNLTRRKYREHLKLKVFALFNNQCNKCGFKDIRALQIDHIRGNGAIERKRYRTSNDEKYYSRLIKLLEMRRNSEYQLLCANCNWIKRFENKEN